MNRVMEVELIVIECGMGRELRAESGPIFICAHRHALLGGGNVNLEVEED